MAAVCLSITAAVNAQTTIFTQNFSNPQEAIDDGWEILIAQGGNTNAGIFDPMPAMQAIGIEGGAIGAMTFTVINTVPTHIPNLDVVISTPVITLPAGDLTLSYKAGSLTVGPADSSHYSVYILTQEEVNPIASAAQLQALLDSKTPEDSDTISGESVITSLDISEYAGEAILVIYRLHDTTTNSLLLFDDVAITQAALGTNDFTAGQFSVYPNPATDVITIKGNEGISFNSVTITDINGRTVASKQLNGDTEAMVDISNLSAGMYIMTAASDKGTSTKKIIKQ